jgi:hypothetical protein
MLVIVCVPGLGDHGTELTDVRGPVVGREKVGAGAAIQADLLTRGAQADGQPPPGPA